MLEKSAHLRMFISNFMRDILSFERHSRNGDGKLLVSVYNLRGTGWCLYVRENECYFSNFRSLNYPISKEGFQNYVREYQEFINENSRGKENE